MEKKIVLIASVTALIISAMLIFNSHVGSVEVPAFNFKCISFKKEMTVRGFSMDPFIKPEQTVTALFGYYNCNPVQRNDIVLYAYSGNDNLLIKFIKAVPGDSWTLKESSGGYGIIVNGLSLLNAEGIAYLIQGSSVKMLELYAKDYPVIPEDTYLLLGDKTDGSLDSTSFGLIGKRDIVAKVEK